MGLVFVKIRLHGERDRCLPVIFCRPGAYMYILIWQPLKKLSNEPLHKTKTYYLSVSECCSFL